MMQKAREMNKPQKPPVLAIIGLLCVMAALAIQTAAVASQEWVVSGDVKYGLWQYCLHGSCSTHPPSVLTNGFKVTRAFSIMAVLMAAMSSAVSLVLICVRERVVSLTAGILALTAALCMLVEFGVFVGDTASSDFGYSLYLAATASVLALTAAICFLLANCMTREKP